MRCPRCGQDVPGTYGRCEICGTPLTMNKKSNLNAKKIVPIVVTGICVVVIFGAVLMFRRQEDIIYRDYVESATRKLEQGDLDDAEAAYLKAADMNTRSKDAEVGLADVYTRKGNTDQAAKMMKEASKNPPKTNSPVYNRYNYYSQYYLADDEEANVVEVEPYSSDADADSTEYTSVQTAEAGTDTDAGADAAAVGTIETDTDDGADAAAVGTIEADTDDGADAAAVGTTEEETDTDAGEDVSSVEAAEEETDTDDEEDASSVETDETDINIEDEEAEDAGDTDMVQTAAAFSISETTLDFGTLEVGYTETTEEKTIQITNNGEEDIMLEAGTPDNFDMIVPDRMIAAAGESLEFRFQPKSDLAEGGYVERIYFYPEGSSSSDPDAVSVELKLSVGSAEVSTEHAYQPDMTGTDDQDAAYSAADSSYSGTADSSDDNADIAIEEYSADTEAWDDIPIDEYDDDSYDSSYEDTYNYDSSYEDTYNYDSSYEDAYDTAYDMYDTQTEEYAYDTSDTGASTYDTGYDDSSSSSVPEVSLDEYASANLPVTFSGTTVSAGSEGQISGIIANRTVDIGGTQVLISISMSGGRMAAETYVSAGTAAGSAVSSHSFSSGSVEYGYRGSQTMCLNGSSLVIISNFIGCNNTVETSVETWTIGSDGSLAAGASGTMVNGNNPDSLIGALSQAGLSGSWVSGYASELQNAGIEADPSVLSMVSEPSTGEGNVLATVNGNMPAGSGSMSVSAY